MPTPVEWFLREEREGDAQLQLGASQEWNWKTGQFRRFVDRHEYLRNVQLELYRFQALQVTAGAYDRPGGCAVPPIYYETREDKRRRAMLQHLQNSLQSRRLKWKMLDHQRTGEPIQGLIAQSTEDSILLDSAQGSLARAAAFCAESAEDSLRLTFQLPRDAQPDQLFNIDLDPESHTYMRWKLPRAAPTLSRAASASQNNYRWGPIERWLRSLSNGSPERPAQSFTGQRNEKYQDVPAQLRSQSYFPQWKVENHNENRPTSMIIERPRFGGGGVVQSQVSFSSRRPEFHSEATHGWPLQGWKPVCVLPPRPPRAVNRKRPKQF